MDSGGDERWAALQRSALEPYLAIGQQAFAVGPACKWTPRQREWIKMMVEEGPTRCVWLAVDPGTEFVGEILEAYGEVTPLADIGAELPYPIDAALEAALSARSDAFVFSPGAEEPFLLVAGL